MKDMHLEPREVVAKEAGGYGDLLVLAEVDWCRLKIFKNEEGKVWALWRENQSHVKIHPIEKFVIKLKCARTLHRFAQQWLMEREMLFNIVICKEIHVVQAWKPNYRDYL